MTVRFLLKVATATTIGTGGYLAGSFAQRKYILDDLEHSLNIHRSVLEDLVNNSEKRARFPFSISVSAATPVPSSAVTPGPGRVSQIMKYGFPSLENVRSLDDFVLSYDRRNRIPNWVFEHLTKETVQKNDKIDRSICDFVPDESIHPYFRSQNTDYKGSGFDRGHMAAAGNHRLHQKHVEQTFLLSNMAPQVGKGFNRDKWNDLERYVRKLTRQYVNVYCCTGPLYLPKKESDGKMYVKYQVLGANTVAVPTHFYKIVVGEAPDGKFHLEAYCLPNQVISNDVPLTSFQVPPDTIERAAGLLFFDKLERKIFTTINGKKL